MADSRAHVPCTSCVRASHRAPPLHLYMVCKSRMQTCTCAACASASSSAQNAVDAGEGAGYSHALLTECAGIARVRGHRAVAPSHREAAQTPVSARLFCLRANWRQKDPAWQGTLGSSYSCGDPWGTLWGLLGDPWGPLVFIQCYNVALSLTLGHIRQICF